MTNCFRFAPRDSVPGLIAKICKYLKEHPGWSEEELEEQFKKFIEQTGVESFNGRTGAVMLNEDDVNNLNISSAYFAEGDETIDELDLVELYNQGVRFVFTNWNGATSGYDLSFVLEYLAASNDVVYYPMSTDSGDGNVLSVNGKTGVIELSLADILGGSGAQVKLCTAAEFTSTTIETWNAYYNDGYRVVGVVNSNATEVDYLYILKQDINNHQPIMVLGGTSDGSVLSVNNQSGDVIIDVVDVSENDSVNEFAKLFINENEEYPITPAIDSDALGGKPPDYYATDESVNKLKNEKADKTGWTGGKNVVTDGEGNLSTEDKPTALPNPFAVTINGQSYDGSKAVDMTVSGLPDGGTAGQVLTKVGDANQDVEWKDPSGGLQMKLLWENAVFGDFAPQTISLDLAENDIVMVLYRDYYENDQAISQILVKNHRAILTLPVDLSKNTRIAERIVEALDDGVHFEDCNATYINSGSKSVDNGLLFPLQIYGIKGVQV